MENQDPRPESIEQMVNSAAAKVKNLADEGIHHAEVYARRYPGRAVAWSVAAGFVLPRLPIAMLLGFIVRLALCLVRPVLLALGLASLCQMAGCCKGKSCKLP